MPSQLLERRPDITAQNAVFTSLEAMVGLQTDRMTTAVQLIVALGGGWDASDLPSPATRAAIRR